MTESIVVVGGGLAAAKAAEGLRAGAYTGQVTVVGDEHHLPYERPPLSKGYLLGNDTLDSTLVHPASWYGDQGVDLSLGSRVMAIDLGRRTVSTTTAELPFDRLLLATGSSPRRLPAADESGVPVAYLRTVEDSDRLKAALHPGQKVVVIGGGWIGLEVASAARTAGCEVAVVETLELPLLRVLGPEVAHVFADLHRSHGVRLATSTSVTSVSPRPGAHVEAAVVHLDDGTALEADLVVVGVGVTPNEAVAEAAGLETDNGVLVDEHLRTSHPDVFAAGDVANALHPLLGRRVRVEHWDNAIEQGLTAARNMLGAGEAYDRLPYFFTDQYDLGMEYVGHVGPEGYDEVVLRGDVPGRTFTAFWLGRGQVLAGMHVNDWDAIDPVRRLVSARSVDLAALRDDSVSLDTLA